MGKMQGKLIVLDGIDGSGKTTQIELLKRYLASQGIAWEAISFPRYGNNKYTNQIEKYLKGELEVDPDTIAKAYAGDRMLAKPEIEGWLKSGKLVIANRYTGANIAHLGIDLKEDMPKPDLTILLDVDPKVGQENALEHQKKDIHEQNLKHLEKAAKIYLELAKSEPNWVVVDCMKDGQMRTPESIHQEIVKILQGVLLSPS